MSPREKHFHRTEITVLKSHAIVHEMLRRDLAEVLEIEKQSFDCAWTEKDFLECLRSGCCRGVVAEQKEKIVGFAIYEPWRSQLHIHNFAVAPWTRRQSIGVQLMEYLIEELTEHKLRKISLEVREKNLSAQLFFQKQGFRAIGILHGHYEDTEEDAYVMHYRPNAHKKQDIPLVLKNRISGAYLGNDDPY